MNIKKLIDNKPILFLIGILAACFAIYYPSLSFKFLMNFDDDILLLSGPEAQEFSFDVLKSIFTEPKYGLYHPITSLTWNLEYTLFGADPFYYHLNNLVFHLINVCLVFVLIAKLFKNNGVALLSAALFAIHPMHVENIVWLSSRKDLVYGLFFLSSLVSYHKYLEKKSISAYVLAILFFILSILSKANAIVLPALFILFDWYKGKSNWLKMIGSKIPWFILSAVIVCITYSTQQAEGFIREIDDTFNIVDRLFLLTYSIGHYFFNFILPIDLDAKNFYPLKDGNMLPILYYLSLIALAVLALVILRSKSKKQLLFAILFALIVLFPVLKLVPTGNDLVSNRYAYMPYVMLYGVFMLLIVNGKKAWLKLVPFLAIALFAFKSYNYQDTYRDSIKLWSSIIENANDNKSMKAMAFNERGQVYLKQGNQTSAIGDISRALKLEPTLLRGLLNRAKLYDLQNKLDLALKDLNKALEKYPESVEALKNRGVILSKQNKAEQAIVDFDKAIGITPKRADLYNNKGIAYSILNNSEAALENFAKAIKLEEEYIDAYVNRANLYIQLNEPLKAQEDLAIAYSNNSDNFIYGYLIAKTHLMTGKPDKADAFLAPFAKDELVAAKVGERLLGDGYPEHSLKYFNIAIGNESIREKTFYQRAQVYKALGQKQNAIDDLMVIIEKMPGGIFFYEIAMLYQELENMEKACKFLNEGAIRDHPQSKAKYDELCN